MLLKLFYTVLIIGGILLVVRSRMALRGAPRQSRDEAPRGVNPRWVAYGITAVIVITSVGITAHQWLSNEDMVAVRVVNANTGQTTVYTAYAHEVEERSFRTADGTLVRLADMERMEVLD
ncbi:MAG: hypothetical protein U5S82_06400 [Gammaproteobacteria bacterium]|nr:hypothetical protein [Gammaproteobacteria bacterium]